MWKKCLENEAIRRTLIYTDDDILELWSEIICFSLFGPHKQDKGHNSTTSDKWHERENIQFAESNQKSFTIGDETK